MNKNLSKLQETAEDRGAWSGRDWATEQQQNFILDLWFEAECY